MPSCALPVYEGMKVKTHSEAAVEARKTIIELLLSDHPDDCNYCSRNLNCGLQTLADQLGVRERKFQRHEQKHHLDISSPAILRDPNKCILCGRCVRVCEEIQNVAAIDFIGRGCDTMVAPAFNSGLNVSTCINCGQCVTACPTGALAENSHVNEVLEALRDPDKIVVVGHAPSISVTLAEAFGLPAGSDVAGKLVNALRRLGFDYVFDVAFSADLTIMEESQELIDRIQNKGKLPMFTSCSPGWVKYVEHFYPDLLDHISTCKSPQQMLGSVIKNIFAAQQEIDPKKLFSVSIMPCTAKKFEAKRPEQAVNGLADVDAVLTTRELAKLIARAGIDFGSLKSDDPDMPFGSRSSAGKLFGASGGVMEAALRTAHHTLTGEELPHRKLSALRGLDGQKRASVSIAGIDLNVAAVSGLNNIKKILDEVRSGRSDLQFVEVMTCPGGCINGGGQPIGTDPDAVKARLKTLYEIDRDAALRTSHGNPAIIKLYEEHLQKPGSHEAHRLLHTSYLERSSDGEA